jgi:hypothetical protein
MSTPLLPAWLPDLTMRNLRIGRHKLDIRFWREDAQTKFEVIKGEPDLVERVCRHRVAYAGALKLYSGSWNPLAYLSFLHAEGGGSG